MLEAYLAVVSMSIAVILFITGGTILTETLIDIWESNTGRTIEDLLGLEEELD